MSSIVIFSKISSISFSTSCIAFSSTFSITSPVGGTEDFSVGCVHPLIKIIKVSTTKSAAIFSVLLTRKKFSYISGGIVLSLSSFTKTYSRRLAFAKDDNSSGIVAENIKVCLFNGVDLRITLV